MRKRTEKKKMGRAPCCDKDGVKKGAWTPEEDEILVDYITKNGHGTWRSLPKLAGLLRCGKSCRLRWTNYLRPDIRRGPFSLEEENTIIQMHGMLGNNGSAMAIHHRVEAALSLGPSWLSGCKSLSPSQLKSMLQRWAAIASHLPGRTDNEVKNFWNSHLKKRFCSIGLNQQTHRPSSSAMSIDMKSESPSTRHMFQWENARVEAEARMSMDSLLLNSSSAGKTDSDYFLRVWNSEVGDSFRKIKDESGVACESSMTQTSSSTKVESGSGVTTQVGPAMTITSTETTNKEKGMEHMSSKKDAEHMMAGSDSSNSYEVDDSSDSALKLLLDFPGSNYMDFLQDEIDDVSIFLQ